MFPALNEPPTTCDQIPSHAPRPEWLARIEAYAAAAWRDRDAYLEGRETNPGFSWTAFDGLTQTAFRLEDDAEEARLLWLNGYEPASEVLPLETPARVGVPTLQEYA